MRAIVKKFIFNELEIIFFSYILEENKWDIDEKVKEAAFQFQDFLNITEVNSQ